MLAAALGGLSGLLAGVVSRWLADGAWRPDRFSLLLGMGGALAAGLQPALFADPLMAASSTAVLCLLIVVMASDVRERAVYPAIVYPGLAFLTATAPLFGRPLVDALLGALVCAALFGLLHLLARLRYGREALGDGDVAVAALLGAVVGFTQLPRALLLVGVFGALIALAVGVRSRSLRASFPYAPAFCLVGLLVRLT